ncbi:MAG: hypothetical protein KAR11_05965 [Phycisphaerae bacterium]|nr:hypothetical protein [Phycisphaerae bacterium]
MKCIIVPCLLVMFVGLIGCSKPDVVVTDSAGTPITGAVVTGICICDGQIITTDTTQTDAKGAAIIPVVTETQPRETNWISITKPGCLPVANIDVNQEKPIKVVMIVLKDVAAW